MLLQFINFIVYPNCWRRIFFNYETCTRALSIYNERVIVTSAVSRESNVYIRVIPLETKKNCCSSKVCYTPDKYHRGKLNPRYMYILFTNYYFFSMIRYSIKGRSVPKSQPCKILIQLWFNAAHIYIYIIILQTLCLHV